MLKLDSRFDFKISGKDRELVEAAAASQDQTLSDFARTAVIDVSRSILSQAVPQKEEGHP